MDRPETIELVGQALRWRTEVPFYTHYKSDDGRAFVALSIVVVSHTASTLALSQALVEQTTKRLTSYEGEKIIGTFLRGLGGDEY